MSDYNAAPGIRASHLVHYLDCPARYRYEVENHRDTTALRRGTLTHSVLFEADSLDSVYLVAPDMDRRKTEGKLAYAAAVASAQEQGKQLVTAKEYATAQAIALASGGMRGHQNTEWQAALHAPDALREQPLFWTDPETGVKCKCKPDLFHEYAWDLKTCRDSRWWSFARDCAKFHYHIKAAFYLRGLRANGYDPRGWRWVAANSASPHFVQIHELDPADAAWADVKVGELLALHAECERTQTWPEYGTEVNVLRMPAYAMDGDEEVELDLGGETVRM